MGHSRNFLVKHKPYFGKNSECGMVSVSGAGMLAYIQESLCPEEKKKVSMEATMETKAGISNSIKHLCTVSISTAFSLDSAENRKRTRTLFPTAVTSKEYINHFIANVFIPDSNIHCIQDKVNQDLLIK
jgi:hypothetical protein